MTFKEIVFMIIETCNSYCRVNHVTSDEIIRCATDIYIQQMKAGEQNEV